MFYGSRCTCCVLHIYIYMFSGIAAVREGSQPPWSPTWLCGFELTNKIIGIYGTSACLMLCLALQKIICINGTLAYLMVFMFSSATRSCYLWYIGLPDVMFSSPTRSCYLWYIGLPDVMLSSPARSRHLWYVGLPDVV